MSCRDDNRSARHPLRTPTRRPRTLGLADILAAHVRRDCPALLDKRLLAAPFYRPSTLTSWQAKTDWIEPDLAPFPWQDVGRGQFREEAER
ncbi:hypothetical protein GCM10010305_33130 [Streptomyces termitum]|uniref:Uncharacterized protein n=1 Tax=Streptomyces termitum TaxID=67368 RepID=A0A918WAS0_9ACTN|nr:hypothetical protein GCM10010305_33130 [Streptomyces termitum]